MNAIDLLTEQHEEADGLIAQLEKADDEEVKAEIFAELADKLAAHVTIEEKIFYPAVNTARTKAKLEEAVEEHLAVKRLIADLIELDPGDDQFDAKISVMKEQLEHHAHDEEEQELFPKVRKLLDADTLDALGGEMATMFEKLLDEGSPRLKVLAETDQAAEVADVPSAALQP